MQRDGCRRCGLAVMDSPDKVRLRRCLGGGPSKSGSSLSGSLATPLIVGTSRSDAAERPLARCDSLRRFCGVVLHVCSARDTQDTFFKRMGSAVPAIPQAVAVRKILPLLSHALEFGGAPPPPPPADAATQPSSSRPRRGCRPRPRPFAFAPLARGYRAAVIGWHGVRFVRVRRRAAVGGGAATADRRDA